MGDTIGSAIEYIGPAAASLEGRPLSVVIPVHNEERTIEQVVHRVSASPVVGQIVVVDDASTDDTTAILSRLRPPGVEFAVLRQAVKRGKGAAVRRGFEIVNRPIVIVQDADLEYDPADYPALIRPILDGKADAVFGSRFLGRGLKGGRHTLANRLLTMWSNLFTGLHVSDVHACYKALDRRLLPRLHLKRDRFDHEPELTVRLARIGARIREVPIRYSPRSRAEGKKIRWPDAFEAFLTTLRTRLAG